nr:hypothetical protein [Tanacetum cinerariifolium]
MNKEIDLEKKINELDNIVYKVGQSAQTVHMLTKPQVFYDDIHKQALGYQNLFYLKKAQRIMPILYDGSVISMQHEVIPMTDEEETLILKECFVDKKLFEIEMKKLNLDNERLLEHIICQDVVNIVMHADVKYVNVLPMQNTFLDDNIALNVLKRENDRLMKLLASQDLVHTAVNSLFVINDYQLVQNPVSPTPYVSPSKKDYEILFQPLFDEHFSPLPCTISSDPVVVTAPRPVDLVVLPSSTAINQDVPSASSSPKNQEIQSQVIHQGVE